MPHALRSRLTFVNERGSFDHRHGWFVAMNEEGTFAGLWNVTGYAVCATLAS